MKVVQESVSRSFLLACPFDRSTLQVDSASACCPTCGQIFRCSENIWRFLPSPNPHQLFLDSYRRVRRDERWGSDDPAYYQALPYVSPDDPHYDVWRVRAVSFETLIALLGPRCRVLDAGAGNGWLSYQLVRRGHCVATLDVNDDEYDGLGAQRFFPLALFACQADFARLPFAANQFDVVIFNASLHYSTDPEQAIRESLRVIVPNGKVIVMDSPMFENRANGEAMLRARAKHYRTRHGFDPDDSISGFLTFGDMARLPCDWQWHESVPSLGWALRPALARVRGKREPPRFGVMVGAVAANGSAPF